jgi:hypothetical protein
MGKSTIKMKLTLNEEIRRISQLISEIAGEGATPPSDNTATGGGGNRGGSGVSRPAYTIPQDLRDAGGVKAFQDWMVSQGLGSELGRAGADGKYGRFTSAAWEKNKASFLNKNDPFLTAGEGTGQIQWSSNDPTVQSQAQGTAPVAQGTAPVAQGTAPVAQGTAPVAQGTPPAATEIVPVPSGNAQNPTDEFLPE